MNPYVQTVLEQKDINEIGYSQCHEHLFIARGTPYKLNKALQIDEYELSLQEVRTYKQKGGTLIVDAQPLGCGRMEEHLIRLSKESGVDIVASTGFHRLDFYTDNHWIFAFDECKLAEVFISEALNGMYIGTDVNVPSVQLNEKVGIIKTAVSTKGIETRNEKMFLAAVEAHHQTGLPIMVHMEKGADPLQVITFFTQKTVLPESLILCHLDRTHYDFELHKEILATGVFVDYDTIGRFKYHDDKTEAMLIENMILAGYSEQLLLSLDTTKERLGTYGGSISLSYLLEVFLPFLRSQGIHKSIIDLITIDNPKKALQVKNKKGG